MSPPRPPWKAILAITLIGVTGALLVGSVPWRWFLFQEIRWDPSSVLRPVYLGHAYAAELQSGLAGQGLLGILCILAACGAALVKRPLGHRCLDLGFALLYLGILLGWVALYGHRDELAYGAHLLGEQSKPYFPNRVVLFFETLERYWPAALALVPLIWWHIHQHRAHVYAAWRKSWDEETGAPGERIIESLRSFGRDKGYRRSWLGSVGLHLLVVLLSLISLPVGCDRYLIPQGSGTPAVPEAVAVKVEKKKQVMLLAVDSPIIFEKPDITKSKVLETIEKVSEKEYETTSQGTPGTLGEGGGDEGGWPDGHPDGMLRFIVLRYGDSSWNDGMTPATGNAFKNFLAKFKEKNSVKFSVAAKAEAKSPEEIKGFEKGYAPPFVYMTGIDGSIRLSKAQSDILRDYCLGGGMIIADAGSSEWVRAFHGWVARTFPGKDFSTIDDQDAVFRVPTQFPNGIDPLFRHGGLTEAKGVRGENQRWMVFFHPGDMNDCWKDDAKRIPKPVRDNAHAMGYNIVYYSFTRYLEATRKYRDK